MTTPNNITVDGNSIVISNCTLTVNNAFDQTTGVATLTITPSGGLGTLPALLQGIPGLSATWRNVNLTEVAFGAALPSPPASVTLISPGGPGVSAVYDLNIALHTGEPGEVGSFLISAAEDLVGSLANGFTIVWNQLEGIFVPQAPLVPSLYWASAISSTSGNPTGLQVLTSITVPTQTFTWNPLVYGACTVNGTVNTQVNLTATVGTTAGVVVTEEFGVVGVPNQRLHLAVAPPTGSATDNVQIKPGSSTTIVISAQQVAATSDDWAIAGGTASFAVGVSPIQIA